MKSACGVRKSWRMDSAPLEGAAPPAHRAGSFRAGLPSRLRAAGVHLSLCLAVYAVAVFLIVTRWYPGFHFRVDGGWQGLRLMAAVDLVIGPLLTLVIFDPFKRRHLIAFDLTCIAIAQVAALTWGFYAIHSQRPVAVSWQGGLFHPVTAQPLKIEKYDLAHLAEMSGERPPLVYVRKPQNGGEESRVAMQSLIGAVMSWEDPFFFTPFAAHWDEVAPKGRSLEAQRKAGAGELDAFVAAHGGDASRWRFFEYDGRYGSCSIALCPDGALIGAFGCKAC